VGLGHHIRHWANGGPTTLSNLALLCRRHHRVVHEEGYQVERRPDGELRFRRPDGRILPAVPPTPELHGDAVQAVRAQNEAAGLQLHARTAMPSWLGERLDVGYAIDVLHPRALNPRLRDCVIVEGERRPLGAHEIEVDVVRLSVDEV
jgi:hypothetical protein